MVDPCLDALHLAIGVDRPDIPAVPELEGQVEGHLRAAVGRRRGCVVRPRRFEEAMRRRDDLHRPVLDDHVQVPVRNRLLASGEERHHGCSAWWKIALDAARPAHVPHVAAADQLNGTKGRRRSRRLVLPDDFTARARRLVIDEELIAAQWKCGPGESRVRGLPQLKPRPGP
jgi:hypothetical protein